MTTATAQTWEARPTAGHDRHGQSAVYDSETGRDIAIVYDGAAHGDLIAAAPELLAVVSDLATWAETRESRFSPQLLEFIERARAAVAKAEGR